MIFNDILKGKGLLLAPEFDALIDKAFKSQRHVGDLLLFYVNGFYQEDILEWNKFRKDKLNPHVVGPGAEGHSEEAHYQFIDIYRQNIHELKHLEYVKQFKFDNWTKEKSNQVAKLIAVEEITIQLEMLIYLKIWEADLIIKKFYQFIRILHGEHYDWYFKVIESNRAVGTGKRQDLIRKQIRDRIKIFSPTVYEYIKKTYITQIRNSISHSNYSFQGRMLQLNNYIKNDPHSQLKAISFDDWIDIFHTTLVLYNEYIRMNNTIRKKYAAIASRTNNCVPILVTQSDKKQYEVLLEYTPEIKRWSYKH